MGTKDKRVDAYIDGAAEFAKPILTHLRKLVHEACPGVEETMKWSFPHFDYQGVMCSMAAFKSHCAFNFWKASLMQDYDSRMQAVGDTAMGNFGRITKVSDLPPKKTLVAYIREAARLNEEGVKVASGRKKSRKELEIPEYFLKAVKKNKQAWTTFEGFSYTNKREYVEWVTGAKTDETRDERLKTAVAWMAEGKVRNWKYVRK